MTSKTRMALLIGSSLSFTATPAMAQGQERALTDIVVTGHRAETMTAEGEPSTTTVPLPDGAEIVAQLPGAAVTDNGPLSGQVQYHGVNGERVATLINGQSFATGGPNAMDPPMHYAPALLIDRVEVARAIGPVRSGPSLGGQVNAVLLSPSFGEGGALTATGLIRTQYRSADDSYGVGGMVGVANDSVRVGVIAAYEKGDDLRFPGGRIASTGFKRSIYGITIGAQAGPGEIEFEYRRQETDQSGNPPFSMDIIYFDTDFLRMAFTGDLTESVQLQVRGGHVAVRHLMDNNSFRTPPTDPTRFRESFATSDSFNGGASLRFGKADSYVMVGGDFDLHTKYMAISNPNNPAFFITAFNDTTTDRLGGFVEARGSLGALNAEIGVCYDHYAQNAKAPVLGSGVMGGPVTLATMFAAEDRRWSGNALDASARLWLYAGAFTPRLVIAYKHRAPTTVERYGWLTIEASGGLADGNIYRGNRALKIERAAIIEAGFDYEANGFTLRPTVYYRRMDDYIQGTPFDNTPGVLNTPVEMVSAANGDPTPLMFRNVDAEIYGADVDVGIALPAGFRFDGVASYVRGKRRDIDDNLYRIAPPNARLTLSYANGGFSLFAQTHLVARQDDVSITNGEAASGGYALFNAGGGFSIGGLNLNAGVENIFDRYYTEHLSGYNRIMGSDVPLLSRLPGAGRSVWVRASFAF